MNNVCKYCMKRFQWIQCLIRHMCAITEWFMFVNTAWKDFVGISIWSGILEKSDNGLCLWILHEIISVDSVSDESHERSRRMVYFSESSVCWVTGKESENDSCLWILHEGISIDLVSYEALQINQKLAHVCEYCMKGFQWI